MLNLFSIPDDNLPSVRRAALTTAIVLVGVCHYSLKIDLSRIGFLSSERPIFDARIGLILILIYLTVRLVLIARWAIPLAHHGVIYGENNVAKMVERLSEIEKIVSARNDLVDSLSRIDVAAINEALRGMISTEAAFGRVETLELYVRSLTEDRSKFFDASDLEELDELRAELGNALVTAKEFNVGATGKQLKLAKDCINSHSEAVKNYGDGLNALHATSHFLELNKFLHSIDVDFQTASRRKKRDAMFFGQWVPIALCLLAVTYGFYDLTAPFQLTPTR